MKRDLTIDIAKGIGIILVVLGHIISFDSISRFIYCFHMPLFFFISGEALYYSYKNNIKFIDFIKKRAKTILTPYFIFSIICFLYWVIIERKIRNQFDISILDNFLNIFLAFGKDYLFSGNVVMWFLPCLLVSLILFYFIMKLNKLKTLVSLILLIIGFILSYYDIILPWTLEIALVAQFFIYTGYLYKSKFNNINKNNNILIIIIGFILVSICTYFNKGVAMLGSVYNNPLLFLLGAYAGIFMILAISNLLCNLKETNVINKQLTFLGINSIIIMACHEPLKRIVLKITSIIFNIDIDIMREGLIYSIINAGIIIIILLPIIFIINRYLPFMIGRKKVKE